MIKKFISKLLGRSAPAADLAPGQAPAGKRVEVGREVHGIDAKLIDERADKVVRTLQQAGYEAYIVGGAVRDLLLGHRPKDFDVATNATPEQVKGLFRRAFIIGRRFRIVHVVYGRGREHEVIEVSTFRAYLDAAAADQVGGNEKTSKGDMAGKSHVVDAAGRVLRDNVWGPQDEDAARRDFTINAMYYDPVRAVLVDYHHGIADAKKRLLRMIGDPTTRYREDPVRLIRAVRFAAKLGFEIEPGTRKPMKQCAELLANVPISRMFDEMIKLLQTGHALASLEELEKQGLHRGIFPLLDAVLDDAHRHDGQEQFIQRALADTDRRVTEGLPVAPSFMLACMLWHEVQSRWARLRGDFPVIQALQQAIDEVFDARIGDISGRGKLAGDMRDVWMMQPRFERRTTSSAAGLIEQLRFRAGFDFLRLRADAGEVSAELVDWWDNYLRASDADRQRMIDEVRQATSPPKRVRGPSRADAPARGAERPAAGGAAAAPAPARHAPVAPNGPAPDGGDNDEEFDRPGSTDQDPAAAPRKRRRRRRRPAGGDAGSASQSAGTSSTTADDERRAPASGDEHH
ncbi:MAG: polynucleotide adenylyltransferase PcnB [Burkholderiales bacterium]|nr:polynucleotide adenylyltransferase PcnB [Burkholderiales bacterium]